MGEKLRLLYLSNETKEGDQRARRKIFSDMLMTGRLEALEVYPYRVVGQADGWMKMMLKLLQVATEFLPTGIYWQGMTVGDIDDGIMEKLKALRSRPVLCNENGDVFGNFWVRPHPKVLPKLCRHMDVTFNSGLGREARYLKREGAQRVYLMPHGYDDVSFGDPFPEDYHPEFDVVMIANATRPRKPFASMPGIKARDSLVKALDHVFGSRLALYGQGWGSLRCARGPVSFFKQHEAYRNARVGVGLPNFFDIDYYESNRPFNAVGTGIPYVSGYSSRFDRILADGVHCFYFRTVDEAVDIVRRVVSLPEEERLAFGKVAADYVRSRHTVRQRMEIIVTTLERAREAARTGASFPEPLYDFFVDEAGAAEARAAT